MTLHRGAPTLHNIDRNRELAVYRYQVGRLVEGSKSTSLQLAQPWQ
jgi:hypothetical protein